ncbi:MAG: hypothetical protein IM558_13420 [Chitinophagaceae bacterium]|nr:hypothetical protein [Chitinophagaceae bacterium]
MFKNFPGRINGYSVIRVGSDGRKVSEKNIGDVFQPAVQSLIGASKKGDLIIFDAILISMSDGTTRNANPMTFKIVE